jgi:hypothetical protein
MLDNIAPAALGLIGLATGVWWGRASVRDQLASARRLAASTAAYFVRAESARSYIKAIETPTMAIDVTELRAATATRRERLAEWAHEIAERAREAARPAPAPRDWEPGEMTAAFRRIVEDFDNDPFAEVTLPAQASPWVHPLAVRHDATQPPIAVAPRELPAPRWETRPAPALRPDTPSRARARRSEAPGLTGRMRAWGGTLLGPVPTLPDLKLPEPFRMPAPRQRLPHDPRRLAMLAADPTRAFRTRTVGA